MVNLLSYFEKQSKSYIVLVGFALIGVIGIADFLSGYELAFSVFYVIPIALVTWFTNQRLGLVTSLLSAIVWVVADFATGHSYSSALIPIWNTLIRLAFFVLITLLLSGLRSTTERERELARIDYLTGIANSRLFYELTQMEIDRFQRYGRPFTLAYIDLDNFKSVNDKFGHLTGDHVLRTVVSAARRNMRKADVVARLGGDEFALLLPETDQESARGILSRIQGNLLEEMRQRNWPITFSIGVLTCSNAPHSADELVRMADDLMYSVKRDGKNAIKYSTYVG
jgi:diguanylate cyclase (GGDEF)-like protein